MENAIKKLLVNIEVFAMEKTFYFLTEEPSIKAGDLVVVETSRGIELGKAVASPVEKEILETDEYPKFLRFGSNEDVKVYEINKERVKEIVDTTQQESNKLELDMKIVSADMMLDNTKVIIYYLSESRVDFRELLKVLANDFKCRIELRQIGTRDKAKMIGGIGICGLKLCCATFLNEFDGISITMAKNQMLALNIPKLSGHCGKLICCLKYENDAYTDLQKTLPRIGTRVRYENDIYKITSMNVITKMIRIENKENIATVPYDTIKDSLLPRDYPMNQPKEALPPPAKEEVKEAGQKDNNTPQNSKPNDNFDGNKQNFHRENRNNQNNNNPQNQRNNQNQNNNQYRGNRNNNQRRFNNNQNRKPLEKDKNPNEKN